MLLALFSFAFAEFELKYQIFNSNQIADLFGRSVATSANGKTVVVGASQYKKLGSVHVFTYDEQQDQYMPLQFILEENTTEYLPQDVGSKVMISDDGNTILITSTYLNYIYNDEVSIMNDTVGNHANPEFDFFDYKNNTYVREIGGCFVYKFDPKTKKYQKVQLIVPKEYAIPQGGFGRSIGGTRDLSKFSAAYYNRLLTVKTGIPNIIGQVFAAEKQSDGTYVLSEPLERPPQINNVSLQRFGAFVTFDSSNNVYVNTRLSYKVKPVPPPIGGTFIYSDPNNINNWDMTGYINESTSWDQYGTSIALMGSSYIAILGENKTIQGIELIERDPITNKWGTIPKQTLIYQGDFRINDMSACTDLHGGLSFLQVTTSKSIPKSERINMIDIYSFEEGTLSLYQQISEPEIMSPYCTEADKQPDGECSSYSQQGVIFPSDFDWDKSTCTKFFLGAMSKFGPGKKSVARNWSRVYGYELVVNEDAKATNKLGAGAITGITVACVVVVLLVIVFVIILVRKGSKESAGPSDEGDSRAAEI